MKKLFLNILASLAVVYAGAQTLVSTSPTNKKPILEEMTGWTCPNCPAGHAVSASLLAANPGNVFVIAYHPTGSNYTNGDPMVSAYAGAFYTSAFIAAGTGARSMPSAMINRRTGSNGDRLLGRSEWPSKVDIMKAETSPLNVGVSSAYNATSKILTVNVEVYFTADVSQAVTLYTMITEDGIIANQSGGSANYVHNHVFRQALPAPSPAQWGQAITTPTTSGTLKTMSFTFDNTTAKYDMSKCKIIAFVRNAANEEIISGNGSAVGSASGVKEALAGISNNFGVFPNPLSDHSVLAINLAKSSALSYQIFDMLGKLVESKDLGFLSTGNYEIELNSQNLPKGVYFISINGAGFENKSIKVIK